MNNLTSYSNNGTNRYKADNNVNFPIIVVSDLPNTCTCLSTAAGFSDYNLWLLIAS